VGLARVLGLARVTAPPRYAQPALAAASTTRYPTQIETMKGGGSSSNHCTPLPR
jgi:hypothetical protein